MIPPAGRGSKCRARSIPPHRGAIKPQHSGDVASEYWLNLHDPAIFAAQQGRTQWVGR
ncbi:hypothetical protein [Sphingomonas glacialis]|uniref:hypothetical protein n=1 Tax=Sphingomonas glacialis TaxID=658225 RepID=UPI0013874EDE|nr:hypothetical protein [Sphingomonas glacialis]